MHLVNLYAYRNRGLDSVETSACWDWLRANYYMKLSMHQDRRVTLILQAT